jgi:hypothetical protein
MNFNSIKLRLQLWYGLILVAVLLGFGFTAYQLQRNRIFSHNDGELHRRPVNFRRSNRRMMRRPAKESAHCPKILTSS